jgi:hypothetical protein
MTPLPSSSFSRLARLGALALVVAGCATTASGEPRSSAPAPARPALLAGSDVSATAVAQAARRLGVPGGPAVEIRRVGGLYEAQAQAAALAAEGYSVVTGLGGQARAAVGEAQAAEVGDGTRWRRLP